MFKDDIVDGNESLDRRVELGEQCIELCGGEGACEDDDERRTYATDAISDILTAVVGPSGAYRQMGVDSSVFVQNDGAYERARELLDDSMRSWEGDAEDYCLGAGANSLSAERFGEILQASQDAEEIVAKLLDHFGN